MYAIIAVFPKYRSHDEMDPISKSIIFMITPLLLYISQFSEKFLFSTLVIFSPFTIILAIEALQYFNTPKSSDGYLVLHIEANPEDVPKESKDLKDTLKAPCRIHHTPEGYYKLWLISAHLTYLAVFEYYLVGSLQLSVSESCLLLLTYMILLIALIDLKYNKQHGRQFKRCLQLICDVAHMASLAQLAYFNLTFSCAPRMTSLFGTKILLPSDCSYAEDNHEARIAMFCGINSAQILFCHLAFELMNSLVGRSKIDR